MKVIILWSLIFVLAITCIALKRHIRWLPLLLVIVMVTFFSLLSPEGNLLGEFLGLHITLGALLSGLFRSGILVFLQLFSKIAISSKIPLPGKAGKFIKAVFADYEKLTSEKFPLKGKKLKGIMEAIDERLLTVWNGENL